MIRTRMRGGARKHYSVREVELDHNVLCTCIYIVAGDRRTIQFAHMFHVYVGLAQGRPNYRLRNRDWKLLT